MGTFKGRARPAEGSPGSSNDAATLRDHRSCLDVDHDPVADLSPLADRLLVEGVGEISLDRLHVVHEPFDEKVIGDFPVGHVASVAPLMKFGHLAAHLDGGTFRRQRAGVVPVDSRLEFEEYDVAYHSGSPAAPCRETGFSGIAVRPFSRVPVGVGGSTGSPPRHSSRTFIAIWGPTAPSFSW